MRAVWLVMRRSPRAVLAALLAFVFLGFLSPLFAQSAAYRVKDLRTQPSTTAWFGGEVAALPDRFLVYGAGPRGVGYEPWISDGTPAGTRLLRDLAPGSLGSGSGLLGRVGGIELFAAWTPEAGTELWRTDGTPEGTVRALDLNPGPGSSSPWPVGVVRGVVVFWAYDGARSGLFASDGTASGTLRLTDRTPGFCSPWWAVDPEPSPVLGDKLFFCGDDVWHGPELWVTDGSAAGTRRVADLVPGTEGSSPGAFLPAVGRMYFTARDPAHGAEMWVTDGTESGTRRVTEIAPGTESSYARPLGEAGGGVVVAAEPECCAWRLYWTDSASEVRQLRADLALVWGSDAGFPGSGLQYGRRVVFFASDNVHGSEPWTTDGTEEGTVSLGDLIPGSQGSVYRGGVVGSRGAYFVAIDPGPVNYLWRTDGTPEGTVRLGPVGWGSSLTGFAELGERDLFEVQFSVGCGHWECDEYELYVTDQTVAGTQRLWPTDLEFTDSDPSVLVARPGGIVFRALHDTDPWWERDPIATESDGTEAGTRPLTIEGGNETLGFGQAVGLPDGGVLFTDDWGFGLWRAEGNLATRVRSSIEGEPSHVEQLAGGKGLTWFANLLMGWRSDGTTVGTFALVTPGGEEPYEPRGFTAVGSRVWFQAFDDAHGHELWESDGAAEGTLVRDLTPGLGSTFADQTSVEIAPLDPAAGTFVFRSQGSLFMYVPEGPTATFLATITDLNDDHGESPLLTSFAGRVWWGDVAPDGTCELGSSDGTAAGTGRVATIGYNVASDFPPDPCPSRPTAFAGRLWFAACDLAAGCELWTSDGTEQGTQLFADIEPGPASLLPTNLTPNGDRMYFSGCTEAEGCEPWATDGSIAGTQRLADIAPGALSSDPHEFTLSSCLVYFAADDGTGAELWAMAIGVFCDGFETGDASRWGVP